MFEVRDSTWPKVVLHLQLLMNLFFFFIYYYFFFVVIFHFFFLYEYFKRTLYMHFKMRFLLMEDFSNLSSIQGEEIFHNYSWSIFAPPFSRRTSIRRKSIMVRGKTNPPIEKGTRFRHAPVYFVFPQLSTLILVARYTMWLKSSSTRGVVFVIGSLWTIGSLQSFSIWHCSIMQSVAVKVYSSSFKLNRWSFLFNFIWTDNPNRKLRRKFRRREKLRLCPNQRVEEENNENRKLCFQKIIDQQ